MEFSWTMRGTLAALALAVGAVPAAATTPGCHSNWPVVAHRAGGIGVKLPATDTPPRACAVETGYATSESTIAATTGGTLVYSPAETENSMARSTDTGATWNI